MGYKSICLAPNSTSAHHLMMNQHQPHDILIKAQIGIVGVVEEMTRRGGARAVLCELVDHSALGRGYSLVLLLETAADPRANETYRHLF